MKIKYEFATSFISVDVDDEWTNILIDLDRVEYNNVTLVLPQALLPGRV